LVDSQAEHILNFAVVELELALVAVTLKVLHAHEMMLAHNLPFE
jgi:hypothetical protein